MIVVTGGSGVLGTALVETLRNNGQHVEVIGSDRVDLRDRDRTIEAIKQLRPSAIYHLAAKVFGLGGNTRFPAEMFSENVRINMNVIDAARHAGCPKIIAVSTVAAYASNLPRPVVENSIWAGPPHQSEAAYGHAKRAMLAQLDAYAQQYGLRFAYPIMTNIYGPHDRFDAEHGHVIPSLIAKFHRAAMNGVAVDVWGTGSAERDFIYAADAADALIRIGRHMEGPVNVATGHVCSIREVVEVLSAHTGVVDIRWDATKPDGQLERSYNIDRLTSLDFKPQMTIKQGIGRTMDWYTDNYPNVRT